MGGIWTHLFEFHSAIFFPIQTSIPPDLTRRTMKGSSPLCQDSKPSFLWDTSQLGLPQPVLGKQSLHRFPFPSPKTLPNRLGTKKRIREWYLTWSTHTMLQRWRMNRPFKNSCATEWLQLTIPYCILEICEDNQIKTFTPRKAFNAAV